MTKASKIELSESERTQLEALVRSRTLQAQAVQRSRIMLLKADGLSIDHIAEMVGLNRKSVMLCLKKFKDGGIENAIYDAPGRGRNVEIKDDEKDWIISIATKKPNKLGNLAKTWSYTQLTAYINKHAESAGYTRLSTVSRSSIKNILDEAGIKPFRMKYAGDKKTSVFDGKVQNILLVCKQAELRIDKEQGAQIFLADYRDKKAAKAVGNSSTDKRYISKGMLYLLVGIVLPTGEMLPMLSERSRNADFTDFLRFIDGKYPESDRIRLILDNHSARASSNARSFLETKPSRFEFVFTPQYGSWLNTVESLFSKMLSQMTGCMSVETLNELKEQFYSSFEEANKGPATSRWKPMVEYDSGS